MNKGGKCNYCQDTFIAPYNQVYKLVDKHIDKYKKGISKEYQIEYLKMLIKMCPFIESYILFNKPDIYKLLAPLYYSTVLMEASYFLRKGYLYSRKDTINSDMIKCDYCGKEACRFHIRYGGFIFGECNKINCSRRFSICGWCQEKITSRLKNKCIYCYKFLSETPIDHGKLEHDIKKII